MLKIWVLLLFLPALLINAEAKSQNIDRSEEQLERHTLGIRLAKSEQECIKSVQGSINRLEQYKQKLNAKEQEAALFALELCETPPEQLHKIATNFEQGTNGYAQNKDTATNILYYTYFAHQDQRALHRLRASGNKIATEPLNKEERKRLYKNIEALEKDNEKLLKEIKEKQKIIEKELGRIGNELEELH